MEQTVPVMMLSGFLGSGKTTMLVRLLQHLQSRGLQPAVLMNEIGEVNLDSMIAGEQGGAAPTREMLGGCICCTMRGDLGLEIKLLLEDVRPDVLVIEATGAADPLEIIDAITEASLLMRVELSRIITIVDAPHLLYQREKGKGKAFRLMRNQVRAASDLVLNKVDLLPPELLDDAWNLLRQWNIVAPIMSMVRCETDFDWLDHGAGQLPDAEQLRSEEPLSAADMLRVGPMAVQTVYLAEPLDAEVFRGRLASLPPSVHRAKGIFTARTGERMLFQYAFQQVEMFAIQPQGKVQDVAVFIGEAVVRSRLLEQLELKPLDNAAVGKA